MQRTGAIRCEAEVRARPGEVLAGTSAEYVLQRRSAQAGVQRVTVTNNSASSSNRRHNNQAPVIYTGVGLGCGDSGSVQVGVMLLGGGGGGSFNGGVVGGAKDAISHKIETLLSVLMQCDGSERWWMCERGRVPCGIQPF